MAKEMSYLEASRQALADAMAADDRVVILGIDSRVGPYGHTAGLCDRFGRDRVMNTPFAEGSFTGAGIGMALAGLRPLVEIMSADYVSMAMDQICNIAASWRYMTAGAFSVPLVMRTLTGSASLGPPHSQSTETFFLQVPSIQVALPATPNDVYGLTRSALQAACPVLIFEHQKLLRRRGPVSGELIPLGQAAVRRPGRHVTVVATLRMVEHALAAAETLAADGIEAEVIDLRSLVPLDMETILSSLRKTRHLVTVEESRRRGGWGAEVTARVAEANWHDLAAPPVRIGGPMLPIPTSRILEQAYLPSEADVLAAVHQVLGR